MPFENFEFTNFWDNSAYAKKEYINAYPSEELIAEVEGELGYKLPESYIWLMKRQNGGVPVNCCFPTAEPTSWAEDHIAITGIMGIGREKNYAVCGSLGSRFMIEEWGYPDIGVAVCDCPSAGHDMVFLDYRECGPRGEPKVVHIDQEYDYEITFLADNFEEFIRGLVNENVYDTSEEEKEDDLKKVRNAPLSLLLSELCEKCDEPAITERWIRAVSEEIVEEKGYFSLHADERSLLLYDIQFWLFTNARPGTEKKQYLDEYKKMIAMADGFSTGGYAPDFVADWLKKRIKEGEITIKNGKITFTKEAENRLMQKRQRYFDSVQE